MLWCIKHTVCEFILHYFIPKIKYNRYHYRSHKVTFSLSNGRSQKFIVLVVHLSTNFNKIKSYKFLNYEDAKSDLKGGITNNLNLGLE